MNKVFLSYKREDASYASVLAQSLKVRGYDVWWDFELLPGDKFADENGDRCGWIDTDLSKKKFIRITGR
ncbi:MAG TPA: TIR domain-containing protein [Gammaproteobacteria bacterium]|nr:TIR domain-containing protein [Gammaproteobacteria bacterium]